MKTDAEWLNALEQAISQYLEQNPTNGGAYGDRWLFDPVAMPKHLRDGIIFYSTGWGWRLRNGWQDVLRKRKAMVEF